MDIADITGYFHDGFLLDIHQVGDVLELFVSSCIVDEEEFPNTPPLSSNGSLQGKLCLSGIKQVFINDKLCKKPLLKEHDHGEIFDLEIKSGEIEMSIEWVDFPQKDLSESNFIVYKITAEKIYWESIPDLEKQYE